MLQILVALIWIAFSFRCYAQDVHSAKISNRSNIATSLGFEDQQGGGFLTGWSGGPPGPVSFENKVVHSGQWSARLARISDSPGGFSTMHKAIAVNFSGKEIEFRGFLRTEDVTGFAGLWMREDGEDGIGLAFDNMENQNIHGTTEWKEYSIKLPLRSQAQHLFFGALLAETGQVWVDDLQLLVDGKPIWEAPAYEPPQTSLDLDHEFDSGSGIAVSNLSKIQVANLATLGKVWGFLKYHHPKVTSGQMQWDYELFRIMPAVLQAHDRTSANQAISKWVAGLGEVRLCSPCASLNETGLVIRPDLQWIRNEKILGKDLSAALQAIYGNRPKIEQQFYVAVAPNIGNPRFQHELSYARVRLPDAGYQILALYRFWNIIQYWYPYRDIVGGKWDDVLTEFIPRIALAKDKPAYQLELLALIARIHDTHANLWSGLDVRPPAGECTLPVSVRFIEDKFVVAGYATPEAAKETGLNPGDIINDLDGVPAPKLVAQWSPYYNGSNDAVRMHDIASSLTRGKCGQVALSIMRNGKALRISSKRVTPVQDPTVAWHDLPGDTFRLLSKDVAYLKLSSVKASEAAHYVESAVGTKGLIVDIRNYPAEFMVFALGSLLVEKETPFARFTGIDISTPGAVHWINTESLEPGKPHYSGKVVVLVDETSVSQSEYTAMAFRSAPNAIVVGSTTAGADGNVSQFALPGGQRTVISGLGVFYPDKKPTQRVGIVPDVEVRPTIAGIRSGRDEVLEEAIRQIVGKTVSAKEIQKMAKP